MDTGMVFETYAGIDLHKTTLTIGALDATGETRLVEKIPTKCTGRILDVLAGLPGPVAVAIESVGMYEWLWELLEGKVEHLVLADAADIKRSSRRGAAKTDKLDALRLARLLLKDEVPISFVPEKTLRTLRKLGRHYHTLSETLAKVKTQMRWILNQHNLPGPTTLTGHSAERWMLGQSHLLDKASLLAWKQQLLLMVHLEADKAEVVREMRLIAKEDRYQDDFQILQSVPGLGDVLSFLVFAEIAGFDRFPNAEAIACYTGLTTRTQESAGKHGAEHISKCGNPTLRWALVEAATTMVRHDRKQKAIYERIAANKGQYGKAIAKVAMARRLIRYLWRMMKDRTMFEKGEPTEEQAKLNKRRLAMRSAS